MAVAKLLNLLAISCLAIIASYAPTPIAAISVTAHHARSNLHAVMAKRKRSETSKRCKPRPSSSLAPKPPVSSVKPSPKPSPKPSYTPAIGGNTAPQPKPAPSSGGTNGLAKVGIAWPEGDAPGIANFKTPRVDMYYTWSPYCVKAADKVGMQCCPMLWGDKQIAKFSSLVKPGYASCVLGFNEPDQSGQSNMTPEHGVDLWRRYIDPLKDQGYKTISPACTSSPAGKKWMQNFMALCKDCRIDAVAVHWYGTDPQEFIDYVQGFYDLFKKPMFITEFACQNFGPGAQCTKDQVFNFMNIVTDWMDRTWFVEQYFAFGVMSDMFNVNKLNQLMGPDHMPTDLGYKYIYG